MAEPASTSVKKGVLAAAIAAIVAAVVTIEGDYVDHPDDPGGATKYGVTETVARANGYRGDMRDLTYEQATKIYVRQYVEKPGFDGIVAYSQALGEELTDSGVNFGPHRPGCWLQTALNALNRQQRDYPDLRVDCAVGPATVAAYAALASKRGDLKACEMVLKLVEAQQGTEYLRLTAANVRLEQFMAGWADHRLGNVPLAHCARGGAR